MVNFVLLIVPRLWLHGQKVSLGCRRPRALRAGAQGANMAWRGSKTPFYLQGEGQTHCGHQHWPFTKPKLLCPRSHQFCVWSHGFFSFSVVFFLHVCSCTSLWGDGEMRLIWTENESVVILYNQEHLFCCWWASLAFWGCAQALKYLLFLHHLFGVLLYTSNGGVLAKPFVGAVPHCQAEPFSHLHPMVSLALRDQSQLFPLDFPEPQLYLDIKPVENRSISPFVS